MGSNSVNLNSTCQSDKLLFLMRIWPSCEVLLKYQLTKRNRASNVTKPRNKFENDVPPTDKPILI